MVYALAALRLNTALPLLLGGAPRLQFGPSPHFPPVELSQKSSVAAARCCGTSAAPTNSAAVVRADRFRRLRLFFRKTPRLFIKHTPRRRIISAARST